MATGAAVATHAVPLSKRCSHGDHQQSHQAQHSSRNLIHNKFSWSEVDGFKAIHTGNAKTGFTRKRRVTFALDQKNSNAKVNVR